MKQSNLGFKEWAILIIVPILMYGFYWYVGFNQVIVKYVVFFTALILLIFNTKSIINSFSKSGSYDGYVALIMLLILFSYLICFIYWGQNPILTYRASADQFLIAYYFILKKFKVNYADLFRIVVFFATFYILLWLIALAAAPRVLFGNLDEVQNDRGFYRILSLRGMDAVCLLFFLCLVKIRDKGVNKIFGIVFAVVCFVVVYFSLSRWIIASLSIVAIFFLFKYNKKVLAVFAVVLVFGGYGLIRNNEVFDTMINMTETQVSERSGNDLRITEYTQFFGVYPFHIGTFMFGNGEPHVVSSYGMREENLKSSIGFNRSDAGYVHVVTSYGFVMLVLYISILIKMTRQKVEYEYVGFKSFVFFLFLVNILKSTFFSYTLTFSICLYALEIERSLVTSSLQAQRKLQSFN